MLNYILRRLLLAIPVLLGASFLVFISIRFIPGDPAVAIAGELATPAYVAQVREELGLNEPLLTQYGIYLQRIIQGDWGRSIRTGAPVTEDLMERLPRTLKLAFLSLGIAALLGIPIGVVSATRANSWIDTSSMIFALLGVSMPIFWLGLMLMIFFAVQLPAWLGMTQPILPPTGMGEGPGSWKYLVMPTLALAANSMAIQARMTRATMLNVLRADYIRAARAKGVREQTVIYKHALRNALVPIVTIIGLQFGTLLGGAVLTETVFAWPGIGRLLIESIGYRDYPVIQGTVLLIAGGFVLVNLLVDVLYAYLNPRIRYD
ncbi:MAG: ABC transporter permease [Chloroflexota bacterium]|jgi:peptide/nickel transport system permease protein